jgi:prolyl 4-hydroxylase
LGNVLSEEECDALIELSKDRLNRSKVGTHHESDIRTSSGIFLSEDDENELVERIEKRIAEIMGIPADNGENLQILRYLPGQEYKPHFDYFQSPSVTNNRISTIVMYLNDVAAGGETFFPALNLSVSPRKGTAVYFEYFYNNPALNEMTLHAGTPVTAGEKWVATKWMRRQRIR